MKTGMARKERLQYLLVGAAGMLTLLMLIGATSYSYSSLNFGRYQLSSWATRLTDDGGVVGAFVMDTVSGETRAAYLRVYGKVDRGRAVKKNLKKPFSAME